MRWGVGWRHLFCGQDEGHDEAVKPQHLCEDQDQDHAHEKPRLLSGASHSGVAHDADGEAGRQTAQAHTKTGTKMQKAPDGGGAENTNINVCEAVQFTV